jgi:Lysylphosphatidylglycerol synthase TM region
MMWHHDGAGTDSRRNWFLACATIAGIGLFAWTVLSVGPTKLLLQLGALAPVLPLLLALAGVRFLLQAAGWQLAMKPSERPPLREAFAAVLAGEAIGYLAWGPVSREPTKALFIGHRTPERSALAAAVVERFVYILAAAILIAAAAAIAAARHHLVGRFLGGLTAVVLVAIAAMRYGKRCSGAFRLDTSTWLALALCATAQEVSNVTEAYLVLAWLGAAPTLASVVVLEGLSRLINSAGQFVPGKLGVSEAATTVLAEGLRLGGAHGLSLSLARRVRSLMWAAVGLAMVAARTMKWQGRGNDAIRSPRDAGGLRAVQSRGVLH